MTVLDDAPQIPEEFVCPISLDLMTSPVMLLQTGHIYDNVQFAQWLREGGTRDPMTNVPLESPVVMRPMLELRSKIEKFAIDNGIQLGKAEFGVIRFVKNSHNTQPTPAEIVRQPRSAFWKAAKNLVTFLFSPEPVMAARIRRQQTGRESVSLQFFR